MSGESVWHFCNTKSSFSPERTAWGDVTAARPYLMLPKFGHSTPRFVFGGRIPTCAAGVFDSLGFSAPRK